LIACPDSVLEARRRAEPVADARAVTRAIDRTAVRVALALGNANPLVLCVMNGGIVYCGRLLARLHFPMELAYAHPARYGDATRGGALTWAAQPDIDLTARQLLIVDDVLDDGNTLAAVREWALARNAARVWATVLVRKVAPRNQAVDVDFIGLHCPDRYLFGCGMDYRGYWRNLPAIYALPGDLERAG